MNDSMTDMHITEDDLVLHYYGEMDTAGEARASSHLAQCSACHAAFTRLQRVLAVVEAAPAMELPDGFERTVWARLEPSLTPPRRHWLKWFVLSPARLAWAAALVVLIAGAFFAGQVTERQAQPTQAAAAGLDLRERILLSDLGEHLDRSQMMLVDLVSADSEGSVDMSFERERAGELVAANRLYRQTAAATGDAAVTELLEDLERLLVDLAASPDELSAEDLQGVRQRIEARGLLFKVRVLSSSVRERQKQQVRTRTGQSS
jgi:hypothetical protein